MLQQESNIHLIKQQQQQNRGFILKPAISTVYGAIKQEIKVVVFFVFFFFFNAARI
jgi:hypothetical protein